MRIGIDISQIVYEGTGVASYTRNLVRELLQMDGDNNQYVLFGASLRHKSILDSFARELQAKNLKFQTSFWLLPPTFTTEIWNQIHHVKIERLIGKVDLFHSSDWTQPPTNARKITTVHDLVVYRYPESSSNKFGFRLSDLSPIPNIVETQKQRLAWVKKECDLIIADSEATKSDIVEILKIPKEKIRVVYLAAGQEYLDYSLQSTAHRNKEIERVRKKYQLRKKYFLAVGTREPRKNFDRLIQAFQNLDNRDVDLAIAGKLGWGESNNSKFKIPNLKLLGYVPQEDLPALFAGAYGFVYPSLYEGFGVPIIEAMTVGTPVVTSNVGSMPEAGGKAATYVDPNDTQSITKGLEKLLETTATQYTRLQKESQNQAGRFSWKKTVSETLKVYDEICSR